ncbi:hypothetical protein [Streptomyces sp. NPDC089919]|uniref:hypothetical protein n=1 Tax=Streptomyces sp. NPDC089919 TaxID=3155188 RepID=UPI0034226E98
MRKALTVPAIALAASLALAAPVAAYAADGTTNPDASPTAPAAHASLMLSAATAKPGDTLEVDVRAPAGSTALAVSSEALGDVTLHPTGNKGTEVDGEWTGRATVAKVADGNYGVALTGAAPDGTKLQASVHLTVKAGKPTPPPVPTTSSVSLSADHGAPGDKIKVTVRTDVKNADAYVRSLAFGGTVRLHQSGHGVWTGTAVVAKDVKLGYYGVDAFAGGKKFDTVKFTATPGQHGGGDDRHDHKHVTPVQPLKPAEHKTPKGSVNTGLAPIGVVTSND